MELWRGHIRLSPFFSAVNFLDDVLALLNHEREYIAYTRGRSNSHSIGTLHGVFTYAKNRGHLGTAQDHETPLFHTNSRDGDCGSRKEIGAGNRDRNLLPRRANCRSDIGDGRQTSRRAYGERCRVA